MEYYLCIFVEVSDKINIINLFKGVDLIVFCFILF